jgi:hypothetical protein
MGKRVQRGREGWARIVRLQKKSGLSARAFCLRESINITSFYKWRGRIEKAVFGSEGKEDSLQSSFIDMGRLGSASSQLTACSIPSLEVTLNFGDGFTLTVRRG